MRAADWVAIVIATIGILGTLAATLIAQRGEARRAQRAGALEHSRRAEDREAALQRERRDAIRADYRETLRFIAHTRLFVSEMKMRIEKLRWVTEHYSSDAREVEDLQARAEMLRRRFLDDLPDVQALVEAWGSEDLIDVFDSIDDFGTRIAAATNLALHLKLDDERPEMSVANAVGEIDALLELLTTARAALKKDLNP